VALTGTGSACSDTVSGISSPVRSLRPVLPRERSRSDEMLELPRWLGTGLVEARLLTWHNRADGERGGPNRGLQGGFHAQSYSTWTMGSAGQVASAHVGSGRAILSGVCRSPASRAAPRSSPGCHARHCMIAFPCTKQWPPDVKVRATRSVCSGLVYQTCGVGEHISVLRTHSEIPSGREPG